MTAAEVLIDETGDSDLVGKAHSTRRRVQISTTFLHDPSYRTPATCVARPASPASTAPPSINASDASRT